MTPADLDQIRALLPPRAPSWVPWTRGVAKAAADIKAIKIAEKPPVEAIE